MATKKQSKTSPKASKKVGRRSRRPATAASHTAVARVEAAQPDQAPAPRDLRLPSPGTVLTKRDRNGAIRCECTIETDGVQYNRTSYRSLSAAAMAAANDLGIKGSQNGFVFWGLTRPTRTGDDVVARLERNWIRYEASARSALASPPKGEPDVVREVLERHRERASAIG